MNDVLGVEVAVGVEVEGRLAGGLPPLPTQASHRPHFVPRPGGSLHALGSLPGHVNELDHVEASVGHVQVVVEAGALTPLRDDGKSRPGHEAHEQQDVDVTGLPTGREGSTRTGRKKSNHHSLSEHQERGYSLLPSVSTSALSGGSGPACRQTQCICEIRLMGRGSLLVGVAYVPSFLSRVSQQKQERETTAPSPPLYRPVALRHQHLPISNLDRDLGL